MLARWSSGSPSLCTCQALIPGPSYGLLCRIRDYHSGDPAGMLSCGHRQASHGRNGRDLMLRVRDSMTRDVVTLGPGASAAKAWSVCQERNIRHVPIVEEGRLVGLVSDRDLRNVRGGRGDRESDTPRWVSLGDMMTRDIVTIHPLDTIEHAAREIYDRKIGCVPVVADDELVGIITSADMMHTLIQLVGAHDIGTWVEVEVPNEPGTLADVTDVIRDRKVNIAGIF